MRKSVIFEKKKVHSLEVEKNTKNCDCYWKTAIDDSAFSSVSACNSNRLQFTSVGRKTYNIAVPKAFENEKNSKHLKIASIVAEWSVEPLRKAIFST